MQQNQPVSDTWSMYILRATSLVAVALRDPAELVEPGTIVRLFVEMTQLQKIATTTRVAEVEKEAEFLVQKGFVRSALMTQLRNSVDDPLLLLFGLTQFSAQTWAEIADFIESTGLYLARWAELVPTEAARALVAFEEVMRQFILELGPQTGQQPFIEALAQFRDIQRLVEVPHESDC